MQLGAVSCVQRAGPCSVAVRPCLARVIDGGRCCADSTRRRASETSHNSKPRLESATRIEGTPIAALGRLATVVSTSVGYGGVLMDPVTTANDAPGEPAARSLLGGLATVALAALGLVACTNPGHHLRNEGMVTQHEENLPRNWKGQHIDRLIHNWGPPSTTTELPHGAHSYMFEHAEYLEGEERYCWAVFVSNAQGVIRSYSVGGSVANCNWILASGKRNPRLGRGGSGLPTQ